MPKVDHHSLWLQCRLREILNYQTPPSQATLHLHLTTGNIRELSINVLNNRAILLRGILLALGFDETLPFRWNLEHKLLQYHLLSTCIPDGMPETFGLNEVQNDIPKGNLHEYLQKRWSDGYVIKSTLGCASRRGDILASGQSTILASALSEYQSGTDAPTINERYMVQQKIRTICEYRVHTVGRSVVIPLILRTYGSTKSLSEFEKRPLINQLEKWLPLLPDALISQTFCGWDVGLDESGQFHIFEINLTGQHTLFRPGFQSSAYLATNRLAELYLAYLIRHLERSHGLVVNYNVESADDELVQGTADMLYRVYMWTRLLDIANSIEELDRESYQTLLTRSNSLRRSACSIQPVYSDIKFVSYLDGLNRLSRDIS